MSPLACIFVTAYRLQEQRINRRRHEWMGRDRRGRGSSETEWSKRVIVWYFLFPCRLRQLKSTVSAFRLCFVSCNYYADVNCKYLQLVWLLRPAFVFFMFSVLFSFTHAFRLFFASSVWLSFALQCELTLPNCTHNWIIIEFEEKWVRVSERV